MSKHLQQKLFEAIQASPTLMVSLNKNADRSEPMNISIKDESLDSVWIFTKKQNRLAGGGKASADYMTKDHTLFASFSGHLVIEDNEDMIKELFTLSIGAWYEDGIQDTSMQVLRFDIESIEIWEKNMSMLNKMTIAAGGNLNEEDVGKHLVVEN